MDKSIAKRLAVLVVWVSVLAFSLAACAAIEPTSAEYGKMTDEGYLKAIGALMREEGHPICDSKNLKKHLGFNYDDSDEIQAWRGRDIKASVAKNLSDPAKRLRLYSGGQIAAEVDSPIACRITIQFAEGRFCDISREKIGTLLKSHEIGGSEPSLHGPNWFPTLLFSPIKERQQMRIVFFTTVGKCLRGFSITSEFGAK